VDRAIDIMKGDSETDEGGDHRPPSHGPAMPVHGADRARRACRHLAPR
jgi:hypothetical protein